MTAHLLSVAGLTLCTRRPHFAGIDTAKFWAGRTPHYPARTYFAILDSLVTTRS